MTTRSVLVCALAALVWSCALGLQRPPPRYSQQYMPQTSFTCRNKIVGSYYADPETDCQLFHVCVSVAGSIQDYRFLCPNDTAFDQESQTCADWYDVDCEAATLYYASDNFDLYRIGSGLESLHYDSIRSDYEPQDHLQRSESNDPIRSPYNSFTSNSNNNNKDNHNNNNHHNNNNNKAKDVEVVKPKSNNQFNTRHQKQYNAQEAEKEKPQEPQEKKTSFRKISRKPQVSSAYASQPTTTSRQPSTPAPPSTQPRYNPNQAFAYSTTTQRATSLGSPKPTQQAASSTQRPTTKYSPPPPATSVRTTEAYANYQTHSTTNSHFNAFGSFNRFESTAKPAHYTEQQQSYSAQYSSQAAPTTTKLYDYSQQQSNYNNYESTKQNANSHGAYNGNSNFNYNNNNNYNNNYNNAQRNVTSYPSTTLTPQYPNHNYDNAHSNDYSYDNYQSKKTDYSSNNNQNSYTSNAYAPTTYSPVTKKFPNQRAFFDKSSAAQSTSQTTKSAQYADTESTKATKKATQFKNYPSQFETSTRSYDFGRSSVGLGFSPSSVNHLAENVRPTTPTPRRAASPTTYNPNSFNGNTHAPAQVSQQPKQYYQNQASKQQQQQYTTTAKYYEETTLRPSAKISKKNDYDYAYYDNDPLAYDNIELEHVNSNKESVKIT